jgi:hypothetical protein
VVLGGPFFQTAAGQSIRFGIDVGVTGSEFDYAAPRPEWEPGWRWFPAVGLVAEVPLGALEGPLGRVLLLQTGARYERPGGQIDWQYQLEPVPGEPITYTGAFSILQHTVAVPALLKVRLLRDRVRLVAGPTARFLLVARKRSETKEPASARSTLESTVTDNLKRLEWTIRYGLEVRPTATVHLQVLYAAGLSDLKRGAEEPVLVSDWRTRGIVFSLIYLRPAS